MKEVYRMRIRRSGRLRACALILAGALVLYGASLLARLNSPSGLRSDASRSGVRVTREEELPALSFYPVVLAETADPLMARIEAARYAPRGAAGYVWRSGHLHRAVAALYLQEEEAERAAENLFGQVQVLCKAGQMRAPGVLLRLTATQEQAEALLAADGILPASVERLGDLAMAIDDGLTDAAGACEALSTEAARIEEARDRLEESYTGGRDAVPRELTALLGDAAAELDAMSREKGMARLALSGRVRCCQAGLAERFCAYRAGLAG